ncbi:P-loop containing nucleoside triphosphate hydrolase protein [Umbelopsis sp. PMI_123]|nr:P-loop containing nucleoside triphosphate hydrolase protein [Umbelopsis sp. PMI_123]
MAPLEIIGSGWGRTGTAAMREALMELGYDVHHMIVILTGPTMDSSVFKEAYEGEDVDWNRAYKRFNAAVDWPTCTFYKTLMKEYPNAKVIHTTRDPEKWYESVKSTIFKFSTGPGDGKPDHINAAMTMAFKVVWGGDLQGKFEDKKEAIRLFKEHEEEVKRTVPADRLLIFETGVDGWDKLCSFLGKEVPNKPWPHINQRETFTSTSEHLVNGTRPCQFTLPN